MSLYNRKQVELVIKDMSARLPYGVKFHYYPEFADGEDEEFDDTVTVVDVADEQIRDENHEDWISIHNVMLYLRPFDIEILTEEEYDFLEGMTFPGDEGDASGIPAHLPQNDVPKLIEFYLSHHIDYLGLIDKKLALKAPDDMYNIK